MKSQLIRKLAGKVSIPFVFYTIYAISFFFVDIIFLKYLSVNTLADWVLFKSVFLILSSISLLGIGVSLVRFRPGFNEVSPIFILQITILSLIFGFAHYFYSKLDVNPLLFFTVYFLGGISLFLYNYYQSKKHFILSHLSFGLWRILFVIFILVSKLLKIEMNILNIAYLIILSQIPILIIFLIEVYANRAKKFVLKVDAEIYKYGFIFFAFAITLSLASYLDQGLISKIVSNEEVGKYFAHFTLLVVPFVFLNKFIGSIVSSYISTNKNLVSSIFSNKFYLFILAFIIVIGALYKPLIWAINIIFEQFYEGKFEVNSMLVLAFLSVGVLRFINVFQSSILGMHANKKQLIFTLLLYIVSFIFQVAVAYIGYKTWKLHILSILGFSVFLNWFLRVVSAHFIVKRINV